MASDLISREALLAEYDRVHVGEAGGARKLIAEAPAVDAEPVRHGEWVRRNSNVYCTVCNKGYRISNGGANVFKFKHCPNCGAKMDGGKKDGD